MSCSNEYFSPFARFAEKAKTPTKTTQNKINVFILKALDLLIQKYNHWSLGSPESLDYKCAFKQLNLPNFGFVVISSIKMLYWPISWIKKNILSRRITIISNLDFVVLCWDMMANLSKYYYNRQFTDRRINIQHVK